MQTFATTRDHLDVILLLLAQPRWATTIDLTLDGHDARKVIRAALDADTRPERKPGDECPVTLDKYQIAAVRKAFTSGMENGILPAVDSVVHLIEVLGLKGERDRDAPKEK